MFQPKPDVPLWTRDLSRAPYYRARDGSGMSRRGGRVFCSGAGGSRRKRPQRRKCKNRRTRGEYKRTARRTPRDCAAVRTTVKQRGMQERRRPGALKTKKPPFAVERRFYGLAPGILLDHHVIHAVGARLSVGAASLVAESNEDGLSGIGRQVDVARIDPGVIGVGVGGQAGR